MKRRNPKDILIPSRADILAMVGKIPKPKDRALIAFLYLTAARITEVVGKGITVELAPAFNRIKAVIEKTRANAIRKQDIEYLEQDGIQYVLIHNVIILKRRKRLLKRTIPINLKKEADIWAYVQAFIEPIYFEDRPLFNMDRTTAYRKIKRHTGLWPHFLRHCRITHLVTDYGFDVTDLVQFTGWAKTDMALEYTHLRPLDLMRKMK